ncbi:MAG: hypothetical protein NUV65_01210 [Candidatus Roizmanbacteria bacterium]|nr:hypothetical protein [Candidatus Roizmanbacteria bacterium]
MLMVFFGEYEMSLTSGARLVLPKKVREAIGGNEFVLTKGFDECLFGYGVGDWHQRSAEFMSRSLIDTEQLGIRRMVFSGAVYIKYDEQGRFVLPKQLSVYAHVETSVVIAGVGDHFEVWGAENWKKYMSSTQNIVDQKL